MTNTKARRRLAELMRGDGHCEACIERALAQFDAGSRDIDISPSDDFLAFARLKGGRWHLHTYSFAVTFH